MRTPSPISALPPRLLHLRLALKLFGRTSYLQVRLEFLRYHTSSPHFSTWVRASIQCYLNFTLDMGDHLVSGLRPRTKRPIQTRFAAAPPLQLNLARDRNSPVHSTKARHHPLTGSDICRHTVSIFHPLPGAFHLSSRYWFTIDH